MQNIDLEIKVIKRFVSKSKQDRFVQFVMAPKNRHKFLSELAHFDSFEWALFESIRGDIDANILHSLEMKGLHNLPCYIISENIKLDMQTIDVRQALNGVIGYGMGSILVFGMADLIFYEGESINTRFLSKPLLD